MLLTGTNYGLRIKGLGLRVKGLGVRAGFTLIEVMVATAVLSFGTVLIYQTFFRSLDLADYSYNYANLAPWMDENIWQVQDSLSKYGLQADIETEGEAVSANKKFRWSLSYRVIDESQVQDLYKIDLVVFLQEGWRKTKFTRSAYAIYEEE